MKIFAVCQSGLGTSFMVEMNIKQALADLGADVDEFEVSHTDVGSVSQWRQRCNLCTDPSWNIHSWVCYRPSRGSNGVGRNRSSIPRDC